MDTITEVQGGLNIISTWGGAPVFIVLIVSSAACIFVSAVLTRNKMFEYAAQNPF